MFENPLSILSDIYYRQGIVIHCHNSFPNSTIHSTEIFFAEISNLLLNNANVNKCFKPCMWFAPKPKIIRFPTVASEFASQKRL